MADEEKDYSKTVMYSQLQPWSSVGAEPVMEKMAGPPVPIRIGVYNYETPKPHPWRPTLGYENIEFTPLPAQPITNSLMDPSYTPKGMATEPLKFPNLVTGFDRNPGHAARAALYTRYTPLEWTQGMLRMYNEADTMRNYSERLRGDTFRLMRDTDEQATLNQRESGRRLGERITEITFWRNEANTELDKVINENVMLMDCRKTIEKTIQDIDALIHIVQECLYQRETRQGIEMVHDQVEVALLEELENYKNGQEKAKTLFEKLETQSRNMRAAQHELEMDVRSKEGALGIDNLCHQLNNFSKGINYYGGIEKYDNTVISFETWAENSNRIVKYSQAERGKSTQLRSDITNLTNMVRGELWDMWSNTNNALARRAAEILEAKSKIQMHLHKVQQEIFEVEKNIGLLRKSIIDKAVSMKVAHTRLEARTHRRDIENCKDNVRDSLVKEVNTLNAGVECLHRKLQETEGQHQMLLKTRTELETELQSKINALFVDREKCMGLRRSFPIATISSG